MTLPSPAGIAAGRRAALEVRRKKAPVVTYAATEADQPGMGLTNRVIPLREKSGERLSRSLGWMGTPPESSSPATPT